MRNNLSTAPGAPKPTDITAKWTFGGTWDPERAAPSVKAVKTTGDAVELTFSELVTVKGAPKLALKGGGTSAYLGGSGTNSLQFARGKAAPAALDLSQGVIFASEAAATARPAKLELPRA
jgi:pectinesterase